MTPQGSQGSYALGVSDAEIARLRRQNDAIGDESRRLFEQLDLRPGARALDVGCGPLGVLEQLAERVGPAGRVVGLDASEAMVAQARAAAAKSAHRNIEVVHADARATGLPRASFDLVHERLVLVNLPLPWHAGIVAEMTALARPGGVVALQEIDGASWACAPAHPAWDRLYGALMAVFARGGCDGCVGRRLPGLLRDAGLQDIRAEAHTGFHAVDHPWRLLLLHFMGVMRARILEAAVSGGASTTVLPLT